MKKNVINDVKIIIGFIILSEIIYMTALEVRIPRDTRALISLIADVILTGTLAVIFFYHHKKVGMAILYGAIAGIVLFPIHLIKYPTITNLYILLGKLLGSVLLAIIFVPLLRKSSSKKLIRKFLNYDIKDVRNQMYGKGDDFSDVSIVDKIRENDVIVRLPIYLEDGATLVVKKIFIDPDNEDKAYFLSNGNRLNYLVLVSIDQSKLFISHLGKPSVSTDRIEKKILEYFN